MFKNTLIFFAANFCLLSHGYQIVIEMPVLFTFIPFTYSIHTSLPGLVGAVFVYKLGEMEIISMLEEAFRFILLMFVKFIKIL